MNDDSMFANKLPMTQRIYFAKLRERLGEVTRQEGSFTEKLERLPANEGKTPIPIMRNMSAIAPVPAFEACWQEIHTRRLNIALGIAQPDTAAGANPEERLTELYGTVIPKGKSAPSTAEKDIAEIDKAVKEEAQRRKDTPTLNEVRDLVLSALGNPNDDTSIAFRLGINFPHPDLEQFQHNLHSKPELALEQGVARSFLLVDNIRNWLGSSASLRRIGRIGSGAPLEERADLGTQAAFAELAIGENLRALVNPDKAAIPNRERIMSMFARVARATTEGFNPEDATDIAIADERLAPAKSPPALTQEELGHAAWAMQELRKAATRFLADKAHSPVEAATAPRAAIHATTGGHLEDSKQHELQVTGKLNEKWAERKYEGHTTGISQK